MKDKKQAVIFYSYSGNTKKIAELIAENTEADLIQIEMLKPYNDFSLIVKGLFQVFRQSTPKLSEEPDLADYSRIYVGTPVWAHTMVPPINTVLEKCDFQNKEVLFFSTHQGGNRNIFKHMRDKLKDVKILGEKDFCKVGENGNIETEVSEWIGLINIRKV